MTEQEIGMRFPSADGGSNNGASHSGMETFSGNKISGLGRETTQNASDANNGLGQPTIVEFKKFEIDPKTLPNYTELFKAIQQGKDFSKNKCPDPKADKLYTSMEEYINRDKIIVLRISDRNTKGATGSDKKYATPWVSMTKGSGVSNKNTSSGGSFGIGKFAMYGCSPLRTVFFNTLDCDGLEAFQGITLISGFEDENGEYNQGSGYYGIKKGCLPIPKQQCLDPNYSVRATGDCGTDIYIVGIHDELCKNNDLTGKLLDGILDGYFYSIINGDLIIKLDDEEVSRSTIRQVLDKYQDSINKHTREYCEVLLEDDENIDTYEAEIEDLGTAVLKIRRGKGLSGRVAYVRSSGLRVDFKKLGSANFTGVLLFKGQELNEFIRSLENTAHTKLQPGRGRGKAGQILRKIGDFCKESINSNIDDEIASAIDPNLDGCLSIDSDGENDGEAVNTRIKSMDIKRKCKTKLKDDDDDAVSKSKKSKSRDNVPKDGGEEQKAEPKPEPDTKPKPEPNVDNPPNTTSTENEPVITKSVAVEHNKRLMLVDNEPGKYKICIKPNKSVKDGELVIKIFGQYTMYPATIKSAYIDEQQLKVDGNKITDFSLKDSKSSYIYVTIEEQDYLSMEVAVNEIIK